MTRISQKGPPWGPDDDRESLIGHAGGQVVKVVGGGGGGGEKCKGT